MRQQAIKRIVRRLVKLVPSRNDFYGDHIEVTANLIAAAKLGAELVPVWLAHENRADAAYWHFETFLANYARYDLEGKVSLISDLGQMWYEFPHEWLWRKLGFRAIKRLTQGSSEERARLFDELGLSAVDRLALITAKS